MQLRELLLGPYSAMFFYIIVLTQPLSARIDLSLSSQLCENDEISILVDTDIDIESYMWAGPFITDDDDINVIVNGPGTYTLTIVSNTTGQPETASIQVQDIPIEGFIITSANVITCTEKVSLLTTNISAPGQYTYLWTSFSGLTLGTNPTLEATFQGIHNLEITNAVGCTSKSSITVDADIPEHIATLRLDSLTCDEVGQLHITSPDEIIAVNWTGPLGFNSSLQNPPISVVGVYKAKITFSDSCQLEKIIKADYFDFAPDVEFTEDVITCDAPAIKTIKNTNPNYQYTWSSIFSTFTSTEAEPLIDHRGVFEVRVSDNTGCEAIYYPIVQVDTVTAKFDIIADTINCRLDSTLLDYNYDNSNFQSYIWSGPGIDADNEDVEKPMVEEGGLYTIIGKTLNGCPFEQSIDVIKDIEPINITNPGETIIVDCTDTNQEITITTDRPAANYQWRKNGVLVSQGMSYRVSEIGDYNVMAIGSNGCSDETVYTVDGDINPPIIINNSTPIINCRDSIATIDVSITDDLGGNDFSYNWYDENNNLISETNLNFDTTTIGSYVIIAENNINGCIAVDTIEVYIDNAAPIIELTADTINCDKSMAAITVTSDTTNVFFSWTTESGIVDNISQISTDGSQAIIIEAEGANACITIDTIMVTHDTITPVTLLSTDSIIACTISNLSIYSTNSEGVRLDYNWYSDNGIISTGSDTEEIIVDGEGVYYLNTENTENFCSHTDSITITAGVSQLENIDLEIINPNCSNEDDGEIIIFGIDNADGELSYALNESQEYQSDPIFENLSPSEYMINLIDGNGCTFDTIISIIPGNTISIEATDIITVDEGASATITTTLNQSGLQASYTWTGADIDPCDTCSIMTFEAFSNQLVTVIAEDENGCTDSIDIEINVNDLPDFWLANIFSPRASDGINRSLPIYIAPFVQSVDGINIFDRWGNEIINLSDLAPEDIDIIWDGTYNGSPVSDGVYSLALKYTLRSGEQISKVQSVTIIN